jgi:hypothetical protein
MARAKGITITGLAEVTKALGTTALYGNALGDSLKRTAAKGRAYVERRVPVASGETRQSLGTGFKPAKGDGRGPGRAITSSVAISNSVSQNAAGEDFRYPWALNYGRAIKGRKSPGYHYAKTAANGGNAGKKLLHWFSGAKNAMKRFVRKDLAQVVKDLEAGYARTTGVTS